jgi:hypothetical protein
VESIVGHIQKAGKTQKNNQILFLKIKIKKMMDSISIKNHQNEETDLGAR